MSRLSDLEFALSVATAADPDRDARRPVIVPDLVRANDWDRETLATMRASLAAALNDPTISNADLKGALQRSAGRAWQMPYDHIFKPREFAEALLVALEVHLGAR